MSVLDWYITGLQYSLVISISYHYLNIIIFMFWVARQRDLDCATFRMPFRLPCTLVISTADNTSWVGQVCGNVFLITAVVASAMVFWPIVLVIGIPIWLVASTRERLYSEK